MKSVLKSMVIILLLAFFAVFAAGCSNSGTHTLKSDNDLLNTDGLQDDGDIILEDGATQDDDTAVVTDSKQDKDSAAGDKDSGIKKDGDSVVNTDEDNAAVTDEDTVIPTDEDTTVVNDEDTILPTCGNSAVDQGEACDGGTEFCTALADYWSGGKAKCNADCLGYDTVTCDRMIVADPELSPVAGTYQTAQDITITSATLGAIIRYTVDGSEPSSTNGTEYTVPIPLLTDTALTIKAKAFKLNWDDSAVITASYLITGKVAAPEFSPAAGNYTTPQTVTITTATPGAEIRYTTDGSIPTASSGTVYTDSFIISATTEVKAIAYKTDWADSSVSEILYTFMEKAVAPSFTPSAGTFASAQNITLYTSTPGASIRYTIDGSDPSSTAGTLYSASFLLSASATVKAVAYKSDMLDSDISSSAYEITGTVAAPEFSPAAGTYNTVKSVTLSTQTAGASIRYTTDGSNPTSSVGAIYSGAITVPATMTINAIAYKSGWLDSTVASATYTMVTAAPEFSPAGGSYSAAQDITITTAMAGASIRYTTDGSIPTASAGTVYSTPVHISASTVLKAIAYKTGCTNSGVTSATYILPNSNIIYVRKNGNDANPGTDPALPKLTIKSAIDSVVTTVGTDIRVAEGTYTESVIVKKGVSLFGGYSASNWANRNISLYPVNIAASTPTAVSFTVDADSAVIVDGFIIVGGSGTTSYGIDISKATPSITNNIISGGSGDTSYGIFVLGTSPKIESNTISGGSGGKSYGIANVILEPVNISDTGTPASPVIINNSIRGGSVNNTESYGIYNEGALPVIKNNTIDGGFGDSAYGIYNASGTLTLKDDGWGGTTANTYQGSMPDIRNNIVFTSGVTTKYCIYEAGTASDPSFVKNNDLFDCSTGLYYDEGTTAITSISSVNALAGGTSAGSNVALAVSFVNRFSGDLRPTSSTPQSVYEGGIDFSSEYTVDRDGVTRTVPWAMGAYETTQDIVSAPVLSPAGGNFSASPISVTITTATSGASIRYTTTGADPTSTSGTVYSGAINVSGASTTIKAIAYKSGMADSQIASGVYVIKVEKPTFDPIGSSYDNNQTVTIATTTSSATIRYTTNGSDPTTTYGTVYSTPITVSQSMTLKAVAYRTGWTTSDITSEDYGFYVADPVINPAGGTYTTSRSITITTDTTGATIRYTTNGNDPTTTSGTVYSGSFTIYSSRTIKAIAYKTGYTTSAITSEVFTIN